MDDSRLERALRQGPPFRTAYIPRPLEVDASVRPDRSTIRRLAIVLVILGLLLVASIAGLALGGFLRQAPALPSGLVVERVGDGQELTITGYLGSVEPVRIVASNLPERVTHLRWTPDARHLAYFEGSANAITGLYVADGDGTDARRVDAPREVSQYGGIGPQSGAIWAPSGELFAVTWSELGCEAPPGQSSCLTPSGIDIFDRTGRFVTTIETTAGTRVLAQWSPDSTLIAWHSARCEDGICLNDAFHWRSVTGPERASTLPLPYGGNVVWSTSNRLLVYTTQGSLAQRIERIYSVSPNGSDLREVPGSVPEGSAVLWSPDGSTVAIGGVSRVTFRDAATGEDAAVSLTARGGTFPESWSPDSKHLVVRGEGDGVRFQMYVIDREALEVIELRDAVEVTWLPIADR